MDGSYDVGGRKLDELCDDSYEETGGDSGEEPLLEKEIKIQEKIIEKQEEVIEEEQLLTKISLMHISVSNDEGETLTFESP